MSFSTGYEIVIESNNEKTLQQALKELRDILYIYYDGDIKKLGDNYLVIIHEETEFTFDYVTDITKELVDKYGCKIEVFAESREVAYFWHFYYDGKMDEPEYDENELCLFTHDGDNDMDFLLSTKPFISDMSVQAAKVFSIKLELFEKWCGFHPITLGDNIYWHYIGRGYDNAKKHIDVSEYYKFVIPEEEKSMKNNEDYKGKTIRSLDSCGKETIDEYDDNGILIHHKDNYEESWWNRKGQLVHTKKWGWEVFYEYDDKGRLIREFYPEGYEITYEYNKEGLLIEEKDSEGHRAVYSYVDGKQKSKICFNSNGRIVYEKNSDRSFRWCENNNQDSFVEEWHGYDDKGQVIYEVFEDGGEQRRYNSKGNEVFCLSYSSFAFKFYDSKNRIIYASYRNDDYWVRVYDDKDRLTIEDYNGHHLDVKEQDFDPSSICDRDGKTLYSYDKMKKEHKWFDDGNTYICRKLSEDKWNYEYEWLEYDANDNLVRRIVFSTDEFKEYYYEYDNKNNLVHLIRKKGHQEWRDYDERGRLIHSKDIWGKETIFEYDGNNIPIHRSEMIDGQVWNDYVYSDNEKLLSFKNFLGEEGTYICNDENILKSDNLPTQTHGLYSNKVLKLLYFKNIWGEEAKYEYDEEGGYKVFEQNDDGEFVLIDQGKCVDHDYDEDCDIPENIDFDVELF